MAGAATSAALVEILAGGTEADLRNIDQAPARGIGLSLRANNKQQQALVRATILELIAQNNEERRATHEEFNRKVDEAKTVINQVNDARAQSETDRAEHEKIVQAEFAKAKQL